MAIDRDENIRRAEKLLRQGKLEAAIAEYERVVEDQPRDWATANLLGDLFVRSGQIERAVAQYARIADHLARDGFLSKATALYKKIVKIHPEDDTALLRAADLTARQGLIADARGFLTALFQQRVRRGDREGAAKVAARLADLDPNDAVCRLEAARLLAEMGESAAAGVQLRAAGQVLTAAGKAAEGIRAWREALRFNPADALTRSLVVQALLGLGDLNAAREYARAAGDLRAVAEAFAGAGRDDDAFATLEQALAADPGSEVLRVETAQAALRRGNYARAGAIMAPLEGDPSPGVLLVRAEIDLRYRRFEQAARRLDACLASGQDVTEQLADLASSIAAGDPEAGFTVIGALLRRADATGDVEMAIASLERFVATAQSHVEALECLVRICDGPFHEDRQYRARVLLADAYLEQAQWADARGVCELLLAQRPEQELHRERLSRALEGLGVPETSVSAIAGPPPPLASDEMLDFLASLPVRPPMEPTAFETDVGLPAPEAGASFSLDLPARVPEAAGFPADESLKVHATELRRSVDEPPLDTPFESLPKAEVYEIDLSGDLEDLLTEAPPPLARGPASGQAPPAGDTDDSLDLDGVFQQMRESAGREAGAAAAARAYERASEHFNRGDREAAVACLREAVRDVSYRFRAASMLARLARERGDMMQAVEWLERAAESPAPSLQASHALLYDLADTLEASGEADRALAVFLELRASAPSYRDVAGRVADLSSRPAGDRSGPA